MRGQFSTKELTSYGGSEADLDMLRLRPGDALRVGTVTERLAGRSPVTAELLAQQTRSYAEQVRSVARTMGDERLARILVATARNELRDLNPYFYIDTVRYAWQADTGLTIDGTFKNFVEARVTEAGG